MRRKAGKEKNENKLTKGKQFKQKKGSKKMKNAGQRKRSKTDENKQRKKKSAFNVKERSTAKNKQKSKTQVGKKKSQDTSLDKKNKHIKIATEKEIENFLRSKPKQKKGKKRKLEENPEKHQKKKRKFMKDEFSLDTAKEKLVSGKFRWLNEQLYTQTSEDAKKLFNSKKGKKNFEIYHAGFMDQVKTWSVNPVDLIIKWIKENTTISDVIADLGCGEAQIAQSLKRQVHSFDFVAKNDCVTIADMKDLPLENGVVDICVMCLSLMGTNYQDFVREAYRILKKTGILKVAEVRSRFTNVEEFVTMMMELGFQLSNQEEPNDFFILFDFQKTKRKPKKKTKTPSTCLAPCMYKKR